MVEFVSLPQVLVSIAERVEFPSRNYPSSLIGKISKQAAHEFWAEHDKAIEWARRMSYAALILNKALHDSPDSQQPQWMILDKAKRFAVRADARQEGIDMLTHATGWGSREINNYDHHFRNAITQGDDALKMPVLKGDDDGLTIKWGWLRFTEIGFDLAPLVAFLDENGISHTLADKIQKSQQVPEVKTEAVGNDGADSQGRIEQKNQPKGTQDKRRTEHFIEWIRRECKYDGSQTNYWLQDELRKDNSRLWGKNETTFNKWLQQDEASEARELIDNLKMNLRQKSAQQETGR